MAADGCNPRTDLAPGVRDGQRPSRAFCMETCAHAGMLTEDQARRLRQRDWISTSHVRYIRPNSTADHHDAHEAGSASIPSACAPMRDSRFAGAHLQEIGRLRAT